jgi:uncharacterized membrane protein YdfJ with MMPL/SSD domain
MTPAETAQASALNTAVAATMASNHTLIPVLLKLGGRQSFFFSPSDRACGIERARKRVLIAQKEYLLRCGARRSWYLHFYKLNMLDSS